VKRQFLFSAVWLLAGLLCLLSWPGEVVASDDAGKKVVEQSPPRAAVGLEGIELEELENDYTPKVKRLIIPPFYQERKGPLVLRFVFPVFFYREREGKGARTDIGILPFYWYYRGDNGKSRADVAFPFYWRFRGPSFKTDIVLQTYFNRSDHGYNVGFAPFVFVGKDKRDQSSYQVIPPVFWRFKEGKKSFLLTGIYYQRMKGDNYHLGLPPLFFAGSNRYKNYLVLLPPVFWRFGNEIDYSTVNVLPPFLFNTREHGWSFGAVPLLYLARDKKWDRTLVTPFYYGSRWPHKDKRGEVLGEGKSYYIPILFTYYRHAPGLSQGGSLIFYHWSWKEGDYFKMFSPFVWLYGNDRTDDKSLLIPPFFFHHKSPVSADTMVSLIYWNFHEYHRERTFAIMPFFAHNWNLYETHWRTWVFPSFDFGKQPRGHHVRLHPIFYLGKKPRKSHLVVAPLWWQFKDEEDDDLVVVPFYWRFRDLLHDDSSTVVFPFWWQFDDKRKQTYDRVAFPFYWDLHKVRKGKRTLLVPPVFWMRRNQESRMTGLLNFVWHKGEVKGNRFWTFNIFPVIGFGKPPAPSGAYWSILRGLVGWRRQGRSKELKLFWVPINLGD